MASLPLSFGEVRKGDVLRRVKLHCEVCDVKCGV